MTHSLRVRLVALSVGLTALSLAASGGVIYLVVQRELVTHADDMLIAQAVTFAALIEYHPEHDHYEFTGQHLLAVEGERLRFSATTEAGKLLAASSAMIEDDPHFQASALSQLTPHAWSWTDRGETWRGVMCSAPVTRDEDDEHPEPASANPRILVRLARPSSELDDRLRHIAQLLAIVTVGLSVLMGVVFGWSIARALRPLDHLTRALATWSGDSKTRLAIPPYPSELIPVISTLNVLFTRIDAAWQRERATGTAIAHEVRTPLAGLRVAIEVALSRERHAGAYRATLNDCLAMVNHVQRLVESLFLLTRLEQGRVPLHSTGIDIDPFLQTTWEAFLPRARERSLSVTWIPGPACRITTDATLLGMVVRNLFDNAVDHADANGRIEVQWSVTDHDVQLIITNSCTTLTAPDLERITMRFWRSDLARSVDDQHCGLGLCLAMDITQVLGGKLIPSLTGGDFSIRMTLLRHTAPGTHDILIDKR